MKTLCPIHRFSYSGSECPFCKKERQERIETVYAEEIEEYTKPKPATDEDILRLAEKFNVKTNKK